MSFDAIRWAMSTHAPSSTAKLLLLVMADFARTPEFKAYASAATLSERSQLDRKTVLANLERLQAARLIERLDEKAGRGGAPVYRLAMDAHRIDSSSTESGSGSSSEPVPNFPGTDPVFPTNQYQFSHEPVPKAGHKPVGTSIEPVRSRCKAQPGTSSRSLSFPMNLEWRPSSEFDAKAKAAGAPIQDQRLMGEALGEFVSFWLTRPDKARSQAEWEHAFIQSFKRYAAKEQAALAQGGQWAPTQRGSDALVAGYMTGAIPMPTRPPTQAELNSLAHGFATGVYGPFDPNSTGVIDMASAQGPRPAVIQRIRGPKPWDGAI